MGVLFTDRREPFDNGTSGAGDLVNEKRVASQEAPLGESLEPSGSAQVLSSAQVSDLSARRRSPTSPKHLTERSPVLRLTNQIWLLTASTPAGGLLTAQRSLVLTSLSAQHG